MLQLGVETASQELLDRLAKGIPATRAGRVVENLAAAGVRTFVYLLFGIPGETSAAVEQTLQWVEEHSPAITFLNLALMNVPLAGEGDEETRATGGRQEPGADLSLYRQGPDGLLPDRGRLRRRLEEARDRPWLRAILARTPPGFTSNHAAFAPLPGPNDGGAGAAKPATYSGPSRNV